MSGTIRVLANGKSTDAITADIEPKCDFLARVHSIVPFTRYDLSDTIRILAYGK
jgi:hypothetical protein